MVRRSCLIVIALFKIPTQVYMVYIYIGTFIHEITVRSPKYVPYTM